MRREWIEISYFTSLFTIGMSPSMRREWIEINSRIVKPRLSRLPPCGGSGLKCGMRNPLNSWDKVSLHAEGVD